VARLYERYADLLPDGPERVRAKADRSFVAMVMGPYDPDRYGSAFAPAIEAVDHRTPDTNSAHGAAALVQRLRAWNDLATDTAIREDDILDLRPDALLYRRTFSGKDRLGGGAFERTLLLLQVFAADGLVVRAEYFETDREADALARFDEVTAKPERRAPPAACGLTPRPRTRPASTPRSLPATPTRFLTFFADECDVVDHTTGVSFDRQRQFSSYRALMSAREPTSRQEPLATLAIRSRSPASRSRRRASPAARSTSGPTRSRK